MDNVNEIDINGCNDSQLLSIQNELHLTSQTETIKHLISVYTHSLEAPLCPDCGHDNRDDNFSDTPEEYLYT